MSERDPARLRDLLDPVGKRLRVDNALSSGAVWRRWAEIVGDEIAAHAEPSSLRSGVLRVRTDSSVWANEISYLANEIRDRVNQAVGRSLVSKVVVWTSQAPVRSPRERDHTRAQGTPAGPSRASTDDPRTALERAFAAWSRKRRSNT